MAHAIEKTPLNWYKHDVRYSLDLLRSYVQSVEDQIGKLIEEFKRSYELQVQDIEDAPEEDWSESGVVPTHGGLDADFWDLENIFEERFPNLQRRSALITLWSFMEHELNGLCQLFTVHQKFEVSVTDMNGRGIERAMLFLEKIWD